MDVQRLMDANESLKTEIWDLREMASDLDLEKEEIVIENQSIKEQNRSLEAKIDCFKAMAEESRKEEEELRATLSQLEETIGCLESQNQALQETNHVLRTEIQSISSHVVFVQDYQAVQDQDLSCVKQVMENILGYFWNLKSKIEITNRHCEEERGQVCELTHTLGELEQIREVQEDEMVFLRGQLEEASSLPKFETGEAARAPSLLHEMVQARLTQDSLAVKNSVLLFLAKLLWLLLVAVVCMGLVSFSVKFYVSAFGDLETGSRWLLFLDRGLELLLEDLSPCRARRARGLLPY